MFIREECSCGARVEAEDDDRQDCQRAVNTWRKLHVCGVRIGYYQTAEHAAYIDGLNGHAEQDRQEEEVGTPVS
jgi:hypothetical protein